MRMNFGCGSIQPDGWVNVDKDSTFEGCDVADAVDGFAFADGAFDYIVANHALQQIPLPDLPAALTELRRVTRVDGAFRILVPDIERGFEAYQMRDRDWFPNGEATVEERFTGWVTWYGTNVTPLVAPALYRLLRPAGWVPISIEATEAEARWPGIFDLDDREGESLTVLYVAV